MCQKEISMRKILLYFIFLLTMGSLAFAQEKQNTFPPGMKQTSLLAAALTATPTASRGQSESPDIRRERVLRTSQWAGLVAGAGISTLHLYWLTQDKGTGWKVWAIALPPILISSCVGMVTTRWAARQIMKGDPKPGKALLKGALYGAIDGTIILVASYLPLFITGHYLHVIHFNTIEGNYMLIKIVGVTIAGSVAYGGTVGLISGAAAGPAISLYLKF